MQQNTLEKISYSKGNAQLLIKQIFEFEEPGPSGRVCSPVIGCFHDKTIISKKIFDWIVIYC